MTSEQERTLKAIIAYCKEKATQNFDVITTIEESNEVVYLDVNYKKTLAKDIGVTINSLESLVRIEKLELIKTYKTKNLSKKIISRRTFSIEVNHKKVAPFESVTVWIFTHIALVSGLIILMIGIMLMISKVNLIGYDTNYGGGFSFKTITPSRMILIGIILILVANGLLKQFSRGTKFNKKKKKS